MKTIVIVHLMSHMNKKVDLPNILTIQILFLSHRAQRKDTSKYNSKGFHDSLWIRKKQMHIQWPLTRFDLPSMLWAVGQPFSGMMWIFFSSLCSCNMHYMLNFHCFFLAALYLISCKYSCFLYIHMHIKCFVTKL